MHARHETDPTSRIVAGTCLGKYQVVRLVAEGGMGAVYEGIHLEIGKKVAIKTMSPALAANPDARARFMREAQLTSRVRHPHAVDVTDVGSEAGQTFLVMEFLEGEDLARNIQRRGALPLDEIADLVLPVLAAVAAAHDEGIIHRDLKPHNIFLSLTRDGTIVPKVLDFGISKGPSELQPGGVPAAGSSPIKTVGLMGSPSYLAPEQLDGTGTVSAASDQYGLGVILYECVTGRAPFYGDDIPKLFSDILSGNQAPASVYRPELPEAFGRIIDRAMSRKPADRFPSVRAMGNALLPFASPKALLAWEAYFGEAAIRAHDAGRAGRASPVPVTAQTPAAQQPVVAPTVAIGSGRVLAREPEAATSMPAVPRRSWAVGVVATLSLAAAAGSLVLWKRTAGTEARAIGSPAPAPVVAPGTQRISIPAQVPKAEPPAPADEAAPARPAKRAKFGANRSPLIE
jgi:eukaryotic-like serine/threonine-protein kinase